MRKTLRLHRLLADIAKGELARGLIGSAIVQLRIDNNVAQKDLAAKLNITPQHLSDIESSRRGISGAVAERLTGVSLGADDGKGA